MSRLTFLPFLVLAFATVAHSGTLDVMFNLVPVPESMWQTKIVKSEQMFSTLMTCAIFYLENKNESIDSFSLRSGVCEIGSLQRDYIEVQSGVEVYVDVNSLGPFPRVGLIGCNNSPRVTELVALSNATNPYNFTSTHIYRGTIGLVFDKKLITCGGFLLNPISHHTTKCEYHPLGTATKHQMAPMLQGRSDFTMTTYTVNGSTKVWALGGFTGTDSDQYEDTTDTTEIWDGHGWSFGPQMPQRLAMHCVASLDGSRLMLIGGAESTNDILDMTITSTWIIDMEHPEVDWVSKDPLNIPRWGHVCGVLIWSDSEPRVIVAGGGNFDDYGIGSVEIYSELSNSWTELTATPMPDQLVSSASVVLDNAFIVMSGKRRFDSFTGYQGKIYKYVPNVGWEVLSFNTPTMATMFSPTAFVF